MVKVTIGYGGSKAEGVADSLDTFLRKEGLDVFFASPKSSDIPQGQTPEQREELIRKNFVDSHIIVYVCHEETPSSEPARKEIDYIIRNRLNNKVIIFSKCEDCIPESARPLWHPLHFVPEKPEESFSRLLNEIYRQFIRLTEPPVIKLEKNGVL